MKVIYVMLMKHLEMGKYMQLKKEGKHVGNYGVTLSDLWMWILRYRMPRTISKFGASQASQLVNVQAAMVRENKSQVAQSLGHSRPLVRQSLWSMKEIPQRLNAKKLYYHDCHK